MFLKKLFLLKIIPVTKDKTSGAHKFHLISLPTLLSTIWFCLTLAYFNYAIYLVDHQDNLNMTARAADNTTKDTRNPKNEPSIDEYIQYAFLAGLFLIILLFPSVLGIFFAFNGSAILETDFFWPKKGWLVVLSLIIFIIAGTTTLSLLLVQYLAMGMSTLKLVHWYVSCQLVNLTAAMIQFIVLMVVSARQTGFINCVRVYASLSRKIKSVKIISSLLQDYENISQGVELLNILEFSIHAPIILCFAYLGLGNSNMGPMAGNICWSSLILAYICLLSDDCYDALQSLLPSIR